MQKMCGIETTYLVINYKFDRRGKLILISILRDNEKILRGN